MEKKNQEQKQKSMKVFKYLTAGGSALITLFLIIQQNVAWTINSKTHIYLIKKCIEPLNFCMAPDKCAKTSLILTFLSFFRLLKSTFCTSNKCLKI